jgi:uncharacterized protein YbjT (DUF2867 family)
VNKVAILVGASGLIGKALQPQLSGAYTKFSAISRKPLQDLPTNGENIVLDFNGQWTLPTCDAIYCALGTTIKVAGSQEKFRQVDFDYVLAAATAAKKAGAQRMGVVSALGANSKSSVFYNKTKGEVEEALKELNFAHLLIVRPSFLAGDRESLGQANRPAEKIALTLSAFFKPIIPAQFRAISADAVARCMVERLGQMQAPIEIIESAELQKWQN